MNKERSATGEDVLGLILMMGGADYTIEDLKRMPRLANKLLEALWTTDQTRFTTEALKRLACADGELDESAYDSVIRKFEDLDFLRFDWDSKFEGKDCYVKGEKLRLIDFKTYDYNFSLVAPAAADFLGLL